MTPNNGAGESQAFAIDPLCQVCEELCVIGSDDTCPGHACRYDANKECPVINV